MIRDDFGEGTPLFSRKTSGRIWGQVVPSGFRGHSWLWFSHHKGPRVMLRATHITESFFFLAVLPLS
jgi:hypothetical protein